MTKNELTYVYLQEQTEYREIQINKIHDLAEDRQSRIEWQTWNYVRRRKSSTKAKPKSTS